MDETEIVNRHYYALMLIGIALPFLLEPFFSLIFYNKGNSDGYLFSASRFIIWGVLGLMFLYARYAEVQAFFLWDEEARRPGFYLKWVFLLYLMIFASGIIAYIPHWLGLHENNLVKHKMDVVVREYPGLGVFTAITAGITEEFFFRGYVMSRLALFFKNKHVVVIISAVLFMSIHLGYKNLGELIFTLLFGIVFGYHYQKYRNIIVLVIVHTIVDLFAVMSILHHK